jgi:hypothetical protein
MFLLPHLVQQYLSVNLIQNFNPEEATCPLQESRMVESEWRALYKAAILELDPEQLQARVKAAEDAINARASGDARIARDERRAMDDALSALRVLKQKRP